MNMKPGDWNCSSCDHLNFSWRDSCQRCADPRPGGRLEDRGDYGSFSSGRSSYGFGSSYQSRGVGSGGDYGRNFGGSGDYRGGYGGGSDYGRNYGGSFGFGGSEVRPGDWYCPAGSCGAHNFASRSSCFKCGEAKDEGINGRSGSYDLGRGGGFDSGSRGSKGSFGFGSSYNSGGSYDSGRGGGFDTGSRDSKGSFGFGSSYNTGGGGGRSGWKAGDWICGRSGCNEHNFASRMECFRCQAPRESGTAV